MEIIEYIRASKHIVLGRNDRACFDFRVKDNFNDEEYYKHQLNCLADEILLGGYSDDSFNKYQFDLPFTRKPSFLCDGELIAGSAISRLFNPEIPSNDVDVYFKSIAHASKFAQINGQKMFSQISHVCAYVSIHDTRYNLIWGIPFDDAYELLSGFDIRACALALDPADNTIYMAKGALADVLQKRIVYQTGARAVTIHRLLKYVKKGFNIDKYQRMILSELIKVGKHSPEIELHTGYGD